MAEILDEIAVFTQQLIETIGYPGIFLVMLLENIFPPIPSDPLLPLAGILVARGEMTFVGVWMTAIFGAVVGSLMLYFVGIWADEKVIRTIIQRYGRWIGVSEIELDRALSMFNRYGPPVVFFGRLFPVMRIGISIVAGMSRMALPKFIVFTTMSSAFATWFYIYAGYLLGENWREFLTIVDDFQPVIIAGAVLLVMIAGLWFLRRQFRARRLRKPALPAPDLEVDMNQMLSPETSTTQPP